MYSFFAGPMAPTAAADEDDDADDDDNRVLAVVMVVALVPPPVVAALTEWEADVLPINDDDGGETTSGDGAAPGWEDVPSGAPCVDIGGGGSGSPYPGEATSSGW